jgi:hypothetical protein
LWRQCNLHHLGLQWKDQNVHQTYFFIFLSCGTISRVFKLVSLRWQSYKFQLGWYSYENPLKHELQLNCVQTQNRDKGVLEHWAPIRPSMPKPNWVFISHTV